MKCNLLGIQSVEGLGVMYDKHLIFRVHKAVHTVEVETGLIELDHTSRLVLAFIGEAEAGRRELMVSDVLRNYELGTPNTILSKIYKLRKGGWIECNPDSKDGRVKRIRLTAKASDAFERMSTVCMGTVLA